MSDVATQPWVALAKFCQCAKHKRYRRFCSRCSFCIAFVLFFTSSCPWGIFKDLPPSPVSIPAIYQAMKNYIPKQLQTPKISLNHSHRIFLEGGFGGRPFFAKKGFPPCFSLLSFKQIWRRCRCGWL